MLEMNLAKHEEEKRKMLKASLANTMEGAEDYGPAPTFL